MCQFDFIGSRHQICSWPRLQISQIYLASPFPVHGPIHWKNKLKSFFVLSACLEHTTLPSSRNPACSHFVFINEPGHSFAQPFSHSRQALGAPEQALNLQKNHKIPLSSSFKTGTIHSNLFPLFSRVNTSDFHTNSVTHTAQKDHPPLLRSLCELNLQKFLIDSRE